jgi:hypothetical protein
MTPRTMASVFIMVVWGLWILTNIIIAIAIITQATHGVDGAQYKAFSLGAALIGVVIAAIFTGVAAALIHIALALAVAVFDIKDDVSEIRRRGEPPLKLSGMPKVRLSAIPQDPTNPSAPPSIEEQDRQLLAKIRGR